MRDYIYSELTYREIPKKNIVFFKNGLTDQEKRKIIDKVGIDNDCEVVILENMSYPIGMVGYMKDNGKIRVVYDRDLMIEDIMNELECNEEDAFDWFSYNTLRGVPYCHSEDAPCPEIIFHSEDRLEEEPIV